MTPARLAEIRAYINRLDLDQLPGWTHEQRIIQDLWDELQVWPGCPTLCDPDCAAICHEVHNPSTKRDHYPEDRRATQLAAAWDEGRDSAGHPVANPYRDGEQQ
jgi:hypothetical protein